jgi:flagellar motility protein MotE (MotC chaperone)
LYKEDIEEQEKFERELSSQDSLEKLVEQSDQMEDDKS